MPAVVLHLLLQITEDCQGVLLMSFADAMQVELKNVTEQQLADGAEIYEKLGKSCLKNRVALTPSNIFERAVHYFQYGYKGSRLPPPGLLKVTSFAC